jgi:four helix bundle protein
MGEVRDSQYAAKAIESYRDLHVWQAAIELTVACYAETKKFPTSETYGLTSQIRRSSTSIAANIAEGYGRDNTGSYVQFLRVAQGSLKELETHIIIAKRIGYLEPSQEEFLLQRSEQIGKMLRALMRSVQRTT